MLWRRLCSGPCHRSRAEAPWFGQWEKIPLRLTDSFQWQTGTGVLGILGTQNRHWLASYTNMKKNPGKIKLSAALSAGDCCWQTRNHLDQRRASPPPKRMGFLVLSRKIQNHWHCQYALRITGIQLCSSRHA